MSPDPRADVVSRQYEKWRYPEPIADLDEYLIDHWQFFDPANDQRVVWPAREPRSELDMLVAGCGTYQASVYAYTNPGVRILAVDISQPSLDHQQYLKDKHGLKNLELRLLPIEELPTLGRDFDFVISTGVLHHLDDPQKGMNALSRCLRPDGTAAIMLYARYGRFGVETLQAAFRDLDLAQDDRSLRIIKDTIDLLADDHPIRPYFTIAPDWHYDAGLVDTFLHGRDRSFTVEDCIDLVNNAGLDFQGWYFNSPYYPHEFVAPDNAFYPAINALPENKMWAVMERIQPKNACHFFMACHPDRPTSSYRPDFSTLDSLDYVPGWRYRCGLSGNEAYRPDWRRALDPTQLAFVQQVDGARTIRQIADAVADTGRLNSPAGREKFARKLFQELWRWDFMSMVLPDKTSRR